MVQLDSRALLVLLEHRVLWAILDHPELREQLVGLVSRDRVATPVRQVL